MHSGIFYVLGHGRPNRPQPGRRERRRVDRQQGPTPAGQYIPNYVWTDTLPGENYRPKNVPVTGAEGLNCALPQDAEPIDYFKLYFADAIIDTIYKETNRYAEHYIEANSASLLFMIGLQQMPMR